MLMNAAKIIFKLHYIHLEIILNIFQICRAYCIIKRKYIGISGPDQAIPDLKNTVCFSLFICQMIGIRKLLF
ncbi:MAG: hypothetical protein B7Z16_12680 [Algoriphagus sp. 32-45-6]|nr:MAG: hypothetical protein B7Z16_12680 [Algoriphagus sp. 32-45-6]